MHRPEGTLAARRVTRHHGAHAVLDEVSLVVPPRARIGVVGANGRGKTTLLRLLAGLDEPDAGSVERTPATLSVGYLPQGDDARGGETLLAYLARRTGVAAAAAAMDALAVRLAGEPALAAEYAEAVDRFVSLGGGDLAARASSVVAEVGLGAALDRDLTAMSGGERARARLAAILLSHVDVLLLDEPTNDLDFTGLAMLEDFLDSTPAALVLVSHDRSLLDRLATRIVELPEGEAAGVREWSGGWSDYEAAREGARLRHYEAYAHSLEERRRVEEQARRMQRWEERGYGQGRKKKKTKDVKGTFERRLARVAVVEKPFEPWELRLELAEAARGPDVVARLAGAVVERGALRLGPLDLELRRGERLSLAGPNGSGKTTLVEALLGRLPLAAGTASLGPGVVVGELEQSRTVFSGDRGALDTFVAVTGLRTEPARTLLAKFGLGAGHVGRPASSLSPGERTRALLATFAARGANLLVLDEPTNHLDLPAIEQLESALDGYDGTVVVVSHDRRFLERVAPTRTLELAAGPAPARRYERARA